MNADFTYAAPGCCSRSTPRTTPRYACKQALAMIAVAFMTLQASAQDTHYSSQKLGPVNTLLSGADDATASDNSAVINNPAGMGFNTRSNLSITTNAYQIDNVRIANGAGQGLDLKSTQLNVIPLILSGIYKHPKLGRWSIGYVLADKQRYKLQASQRFDGFLNVINDAYSSGQEEYVAQLDIKSMLSETWAGIAVACKIDDHFSAGIANLGAYREHNWSYSYLARAITDHVAAQNTVSANYLYDVSYYNIRSMFKLGLSYTTRKFDAGLTLMLPGFNVYSNAVVSSDFSGTNVLLVDSTGLRGSFLANDRQAGLKAKYRSPLSLAAGISYRVTAGTRICASAEFFGRVQPYRVIEPAPANFIRPSGISGIGSDELLSVSEAAKPVVNIAIGMETQLRSGYSLLVGIRNNQSYSTQNASAAGNDISISSLTIYHGSIGVVARRSKSDVCIGVAGSYGSNRIPQAANLNAPVDNITLRGETRDVQYRYWNMAGVLGYIHYLR